jgi:hypothetical protein
MKHRQHGLEHRQHGLVYTGNTDWSKGNIDRMGRPETNGRKEGKQSRKERNDLSSLF